MEISWTSHAKYKMQYYRLSESRVRRVIGNPLRIEEGIADGTVAMMQPAGTKAHPYEIWVMFSKSASANNYLPTGQAGKLSTKNLRVISAWRYPGRTKPGDPLPREIMMEFREAIR